MTNKYQTTGVCDYGRMHDAPMHSGESQVNTNNGTLVYIRQGLSFNCQLFGDHHGISCLAATPRELPAHPYLQNKKERKGGQVAMTVYFIYLHKIVIEMNYIFTSRYVESVKLHVLYFRQEL